MNMTVDFLSVYGILGMSHFFSSSVVLHYKYYHFDISSEMIVKIWKSTFGIYSILH